MQSLVIYILCHNRPEDACHAIRSALAQTDHNYTLIVSDNSSNDEVELMVEQNFPDIQYVRRQPVLRALEHFNCCIAETSAKYFCLFHDDDLMSSEFVQEIHSAIATFPDAIAIGSNARIEVLGKPQSKLSFLSRHDYEVITSPKNLATRYFGRHQSGIAPFPSYVYRKDKISKLKFSSHEGKYSDVTWLLRVAALGQIIWITKPLMTYRIHGGNDGLVESRRDRLRFLGYLKQQLNVLGGGLLSDYRFGFIYKMINKTADIRYPARLLLARKFLSQYRWRRYTRTETWYAMIKRALNKKITYS
jgi:GT2 family glycosyltransferase